MHFAVAVFGAPTSTEAPQCAVAFVKAAISQGHRVARVFFYHEAVSLAWGDQQDPEIGPLLAEWAALRLEGVELSVCIGAAERRGFTSPSMATCFEVTGLGQLIDAIVQADRFIAFTD